MPSLPLLAARLFNTPLLVDETYARIVTTVLASRMGVQPLMKAADIPPGKPARMPTLTESGILIVPVVGGLVHRGDSLDAESGTESYTHLNNVIVRGLRDPECKGLMLDVDSPGGEAGGCFEFADTILEARRVKPIWGVANTQACSAAYMILASCTKSFASPSAHIGSIGVAWLHVDMSKMMQEAGLVTTWVYAGAHKVDGNPFDKLSKDVKAEIQTSIDESYSLFVEAVARRRPINAEAIRATEARVYRASEALDLKLIDGLNSYQGTLEALETSLGSKSQIFVQPQETELMTTPAAPNTITAEAHAAAVASATETGRALGRQEASEILASEHARGRESLAAVMIADASIKPASALAMLAKAPAAQAPAPAGGKLAKLMGAPEDNNPAVGTGGDPDPGTGVDRTARIAELKAVGKKTR